MCAVPCCIRGTCPVSEPASIPCAAEGPAPRPGRARKALAILAIAAWAGLMLIAISTLGLPHLAPLPQARSRDEQMLEALLALRSRPGRALMVHVIYAHCSCTDRLFR